jgi:short-subunit dehydrogenase
MSIRYVVSDEAFESSIGMVLRADPPIDILVNNAGAGLLGGFAHADPADLEKLLRLNVLAPTLLTSAVINGMIARGSGAIINVASVLGLLPEYSPGIYAATKSYVLTMSQSLAAEVSSKGVYVQAVLPAATVLRSTSARAATSTKFRMLWKLKTWSTQRSSDSTARNLSRFLLCRTLQHGNPSKKQDEFSLKALATRNRHNATAYNRSGRLFAPGYGSCLP